MKTRMCKKPVRKRYSLFLLVGAITVYLQIDLNYIRYNKGKEKYLIKCNLLDIKKKTNKSRKFGIFPF